MATPVNAKALSTESLTAVKPCDTAEVKSLLLRIDQINEMDKSSLKSSEKRELRKEVKTIKKRLSSIGGGVYISAGALILILILLIIFL
ncbi:MAG: hypothetical protein H7321_03340 [Bacteroidia bacterium]|nr:hypothetical protein [Bacteroidia bacterium]